MSIRFKRHPCLARGSRSLTVVATEQQPRAQDKTPQFDTAALDTFIVLIYMPVKAKGSQNVWVFSTFDSIVRHLIDTNRDRQDQPIILTGFNFHAIGVANAEPLLGNLRHLIPAFADGVFMIQDIAFYL